jgi:hypothetical protein
MAELTTISNMLKEIQAAYPHWKAEEDTIRVWTVYLLDLDDDMLVASVRKFISSSGHAFAPTIPEIRKIATELYMEIDDVPSAFEAWGIVQAEIVRVGSYGTPEFKNRVVEMTVRRFGWRTLCLSETEMVDRAHFTKAYDAMLKNEIGKETRLPQITQFVQKQITSRINLLSDKMSKGRLP